MGIGPDDYSECPGIPKSVRQMATDTHETRPMFRRIAVACYPYWITLRTGWRSPRDSTGSLRSMSTISRLT